MLWESNSMTGPIGHSQSLTAFFEQKPSMAYTSSLACSRWTKKSERPDPYSIHTKRCWFISNRFIHLIHFKEVFAVLPLVWKWMNKSFPPILLTAWKISAIQNLYGLKDWWLNSCFININLKSAIVSTKDFMKSVNYLILVHVTFERLKNRKVGKYAHVLSSTHNMHFLRTEGQIK